MRVLLLGFALLLLGPDFAHAHDRSQSFSHWQIDDRTLRGEFTIDARRATLLLAEAPVTAGSLAELLAAHLGATVILRQDGDICPAPRPVQPLPAAAGWLRASLEFRCPSALSEQAPQLRIGALFRYAATHLHLVSWRDATGQHRERILSPQNDHLNLSGDTHSPGGFGALLWHGATHVMSGADHVAFLAALLLLVAGWRARLITITGFTLGHSLTLGLAAVGLITPAGATVEALIALSVALAALQAARQRGWLTPAVLAAGGATWLMLAAGLMLGGQSALSGWTWLAGGLMGLWLLRDPRSGGHSEGGLAAGFGLLHGAGFAGALNFAGLPSDALLSSLLAFNLGVELGQILLLILMLLAAGILRRLPGIDSAAATAASIALLCGAGSYWFALRAVA